jgi:hypothetical protein
LPSATRSSGSATRRPSASRGRAGEPTPAARRLREPEERERGSVVSSDYLLKTADR